VKLSEFSGPDLRQLDAWLREHGGSFDTFFHALDGGETEKRLIAASRRVLVGNVELAEQLRGRHPDVRELWCPGTILLPQRFDDTEISVFTFGMAHKIKVPYYRKLRDLLAASGKTYRVFVSTAIHENTNFDDTFIVRFEELQAIFNGQIYFMGYLSDTAVFNHLIDATFLAAFFDRGLRANNTTVNAAMELGCAVLTNLDKFSPVGYEHGRTVLDINRLESLPPLGEIADIGRAARVVAHGRYGWDRLITEIRPATLE
jgi:hypothetical protein